MKRRLSAGIALVGSPKVLVLDEPSAGLDPLARRLLWNTMIRTMGDRAVILTTHSMDEAEALCTRLGILIQGRMRCIGTSQHLKNKFGKGYEVSIHMKQNDLSEVTKVVRAFVSKHKSAILLERRENGVRFLIPAERNKQFAVSCLFETLEDLNKIHRIDFYGVTQGSLEQIFLDFANAVNGTESISQDSAIESRPFDSTDVIHTHKWNEEHDEGAAEPLLDEEHRGGSFDVTPVGNRRTHGDGDGFSDSEEATETNTDEEYCDLAIV